MEADKDSNLHIIGIDCLAEQVICEYYLSNPADRNNREYTPEKQLSRSKAPEFSDNAQISITQKDGIYSAEHPKAKSTDGMPVFVYRAYVYDENGNMISNDKTVPSYYLYEPEEIVTTNLGKLAKGRYKIKVFAENCYKIKSEPIETEIEI